MTTVDVATDSDLARAASGGDRDAFTALVRRYQGMVAGLIYASVGDVHQSEELAQETFVKAWTSLGGLREPERVAAWLCRIARNSVVDAARRRSVEQAGLRSLGEVVPRSIPAADAAVLSAEEKELLWRTLSEIPDREREVMVLYYRQGQSTADVAAALEISEEAVRQRLVRGRRMLRERIADIIETGITRSKPGAAFTVAVVATLPALLPGTAKAVTAGSVGGVAAKGAVAGAGAASGISLAGLAMWVGPAMGMIGGVLGTRASIQAAQTPRERRFIIRSGVVIWVFVVVALVVGFALHSLRTTYRWSGQTFGVIQAAYWLVYTALLMTMIVKLNRRHAAVRREEGIEDGVAKPSASFARGMSEPHRAWMILGTTIGSIAWLLVSAVRAGDMVTAAVVCALVNGLIAVAIYFNRGKTARETMRYMVVHTAALLGIIAVTMNLRLHAWLAVTGNISLAEAKERLPFWLLNVLLVAIGLAVEGAMMALVWSQREGSDARMRNSGRTAGYGEESHP